MYKTLNQKEQRLGAEKYNNQGCLMKIITYNSATDIIVEFQDKYKCQINCEYKQFKNGNLVNPYFPNVFNKGMVGSKYSCKENNKDCKEYMIWHSMLSRCYSNYTKSKQHSYQNVSCCEEWLLFDNFYEWLHSQTNFKKWKNLSRGALDKDILVKGNKIYSPQTCCLVPNNVNALFTKRNVYRGNTPIGVSYHKRDHIYEAHCNDGFGIPQYLGRFSTSEEAFDVYKTYKESLIKKIAINEYLNKSITKECYEAMMKYIVEITD